MIFAPPGSAKSTFISQLLPTHLFARFPGCQIIGASHTSDLAEDFSGKIHSIIRDHERLLGYGLKSESRGRWYTTNGGSYLAAGVGGAIPGFRADFGIIDDPIKGRQAADSEADRKRVWDWYLGDFERRLTPGAPVILMHCMTGDTPVLMADGSERALAYIRPGDVIATYDHGTVSASVVKNWANQGSDNVFEIRMKSGITVKANERHPFLVNRDGAQEWVRVRNLKARDKIVQIVRAKEPGRKPSASMKGVIQECEPKATACGTTIKQDGIVDIERHQSIQRHIEKDICVIDTVSSLSIMNDCLSNKEAYVLFADEQIHQEGKNTSALTTIMKRGKLEDYSATTAISLSKKGKLNKYCLWPLDISEITLDEITSISDAGYEDVFDIEVDRTENFIANGLVSHNTRWHEDDLAGRLLSSEPDRWKVLLLPAEAEENDPLGREPGEFLWNDDAYGYGASLADIKRSLEAAGASREWYSQYQQRPRPYEGALFKVGLIGVLPVPLAGGNVVRAWDLASTEAKQNRRDPDWTRGVKLQRAPDGRYVVLDVTGIRGGPDEVKRLVMSTAQQDGHACRIGLWQDPGQAGKAQVLDYTRALAGYTVEAIPATGDKETYARPVASQCNVGNLYMVAGPWNRPFIEELGGFPFATHDDQVDGLSRAFMIVGLAPPPMRISAMARRG